MNKTINKKAFKTTKTETTTKSYNNWSKRHHKVSNNIHWYMTLSTDKSTIKTTANKSMLMETIKILIIIIILIMRKDIINEHKYSLVISIKELWRNKWNWLEILGKLISLSRKIYFLHSAYILLIFRHIFLYIFCWVSYRISKINIFYWRPNWLSMTFQLSPLILFIALAALHNCIKLFQRQNCFEQFRYET